MRNSSPRRGKGDKRSRGSGAGPSISAPPAPPPGKEAPECGWWRGNRKWATAALAVMILAVAWGVLCLRAASHYRAGQELAKAGKTLEACREFESAVGCYAPFNPYCRAAAEQMLAMARDEQDRDPALAAETLERLRRALRSLRWLVQPHADLLAAAGSREAPRVPRDPRASLFLLSFLALLAWLMAPWLPLRVRHKLLLGAVAFTAWALLLYLC